MTGLSPLFFVSFCAMAEDIAVVPALPAELWVVVGESFSPRTTLVEWARMRETGMFDTLGITFSQAFTKWVRCQELGAQFGISTVVENDVSFLKEFICGEDSLLTTVCITNDFSYE